MMGLSTTGSISLGMALVAGKKRVPNPAAGKTALRIRIFSMLNRFLQMLSINSEFHLRRYKHIPYRSISIAASGKCGTYQHEMTFSVRIVVCPGGGYSTSDGSPNKARRTMGKGAPP